jgi:hypothetical protein
MVSLGVATTARPPYLQLLKTLPAPLTCSSGYCAGDTHTVTAALFFAELQGQAGVGEVRPPPLRHASLSLTAPPDHARAADVDVLNARLEVAALRDRRAEGIKVDNDEVDGRHAVRGHVRFVLGVAADAEEAAVNSRVQGLDPAVKELGKAGVLGDIRDGQAGVADSLRGPAGREKLVQAQAANKSRPSTPALSCSSTRIAKDVHQCTRLPLRRLQRGSS